MQQTFAIIELSTNSNNLQSASHFETALETTFFHSSLKTLDFDDSE